MFSHRTKLDLSSLALDGNYVSLTETVFLQVLYAHTRATSIHNFCIPHSFTAFAKFSHYLDMYWSLTFLSGNDPTLPNNDSITGMYVGHPQGKLQAIYYRDYFGAQNLEEGHKMQKKNHGII